MIVILYDSDCHITHTIAQRILSGLQSENVTARLMSVDGVNEARLNLADCIIFGCRTGFTPGITTKMSQFMDSTRDRFENQAWKNKFAAGFTTSTGSNSTNVIQDFCNFAAKHSMLWISQGHLEENEGHNRPIDTRINSNSSFLGCTASVSQGNLTAEYFGRRVAQQTKRLLNPRQQ